MFPVSGVTPPAPVLRSQNGDLGVTGGSSRVDAADGVEASPTSPGSPARAADPAAAGTADLDVDPPAKQSIMTTAEQVRLVREQHWDATLRQAARVSILMADPAPSPADREQRITDLATLQRTTASTR